VHRLLIIVFFVFYASVSGAQKTNVYPKAPKDSIVDIYFETPIIDPYQWMENPDDPRLTDWLESQKKITKREANKHVKVWTLEAQIASLFNDIEKKTIDVLFVGTVRSDRFSLIRQTEQYLEKTNLSSYFYLYFPSRILFFKKKLTDPDFKRVSINDFNFNLISLNRISSLMEKSFSSLDMKPPNQSGLTMRTIEVLGAQRKLITTNEQVQKYDFFDEQNIAVLKKDFNEIDLDFFNTPFKEIPKDIYEKYYLERWLDDVFR
jgi:prolyl oligopeptidase PreP (S9A serine peptidase family)